MTDNLDKEIEITCEGGLCDNCKAEIKEEIDYLRDLLEADLNDETRELIKDIIHGYVCELYSVADEYVEEGEEDDQEDTKEVRVHGIKIDSLKDLLTHLTRRTTE